MFLFLFYCSCSSVEIVSTSKKTDAIYWFELCLWFFKPPQEGESSTKEKEDAEDSEDSGN